MRSFLKIRNAIEKSMDLSLKKVYLTFILLLYSTDLSLKKVYLTFMLLLYSRDLSLKNVYLTFFVIVVVVLLQCSHPHI